MCSSFTIVRLELGELDQVFHVMHLKEVVDRGWLDLRIATTIRLILHPCDSLETPIDVETVSR